MPQLPVELIVMIINLADENDSAINWCRATEGNGLLYKAAMTQQWKSTYICVADLAAAPVEYDDKENIHHSQILECGRMAKANRDPQSKINQAVRAGQYIRRLYFDLRPDTLEPPGAYPPNYHGCETTYLTAEYSAEILLPRLTSLETLILDGCVTNNIAKWIPASCRFLKVRLNRSEIPFRGEDNALNDDPCPPLSWNLQVPHLETLEIGDVVFGEADRLTAFIEALPELRSLSITAKHRPTLSRGVSNEIDGPLGSLLGRRRWHNPQMFGPQTRLLERLPASLRSLSLVDNHRIGLLRLHIDPYLADGTKTSTCSITELKTQLDDLNTTPSILSWLPNSCLERLSISSGCARDMLNDRGLDGLVPINKIVTAHQETLEETVMTHAWFTRRDLAERFNATWEGKFAITELVLGLTEPQARRHQHDESITRHASFKDYLFGQEPLSPRHTPLHPSSPPLWNPILPRWGMKLRRLRLENMEVDGVVVDGIDHPSLEKLRVLIITPHGGTLVKHYPEPLQDFAEGRLAREVARRASGSLRYLSIGKDTFWVGRGEQNEPNKEGNSSRDDTKVIHYADATPTQRTEIQTWLSDEDRAFIDPLSRLNLPRHERVWLGEEEPDLEFVTGWNFMVARRID